MQAHHLIASEEIWALTLLAVLVLLMFLVILLICLQPREARRRLFRVPFVPVVPAISIFINIYLMLQLDSWTWIRFGVWMIVGKSSSTLIIPLHVVENNACGIN